MQPILLILSFLAKNNVLFHKIYLSQDLLQSTQFQHTQHLFNLGTWL